MHYAVAVAFTVVAAVSALGDIGLVTWLHPQAGKIDGAAWAQRFLNADTVQRHDELRDELFGEYEKRFKYGRGAGPA